MQDNHPTVSPVVTVDAGMHGAFWEASHHPIHSASVALHWVFDEYAHEEHPRHVPPHFGFIESAAMSRAMDHL